MPKAKITLTPPTKQETVLTVHLELTAEEAEFVLTLCNSVGGCSLRSWRKHANNIGGLLICLGFRTRGDLIDRELGGSGDIFFKSVSWEKRASDLKTEKGA